MKQNEYEDYEYEEDVKDSLKLFASIIVPVLIFFVAIWFLSA
jgi:hypothetical protein